MSKIIIVVIFGIILIVSVVWVGTSMNDVFVAQREADEAHKDVEQAQREVDQAQLELDQALNEEVSKLRGCINVSGYDACRNASIDRCVSQGELSLNKCTEGFELIAKEL
jgi:predicted Holliday junction resolvase-like endonuclease